MTPNHKFKQTLGEINQMSLDDTDGKLLLEDETLRDGLQMESRIFSLNEKLQLFQMLQKAGLKRIQVGSFVHPKAIPQFKDMKEVVEGIYDIQGVTFSTLVPNLRGAQDALESGIEKILKSEGI